MVVHFRFVTLFSACAVSLSLVLGCGSGEQANEDQEGGGAQEVVDPHDVPITPEQEQQLREETAEFADAVAVIKGLRDTLAKETADGMPENPFAAHQALDKAELVTKWLPQIARDAEVSKEHWEAITTAANELREAFDAVHLRIDDKKDPDFASVQESMDARIAELEAIAQ